jgi:hypothetical protein
MPAVLLDPLVIGGLINMVRCKNKEVKKEVDVDIRVVVGTDFCTRGAGVGAGIDHNQRNQLRFEHDEPFPDR